MSETARWTGPAPPQQQRAQQGDGQASGANLADILERVLDKGIVIAGDIQVNLLDIELLTIKIRLVVASVDRAKEMGIDWWERDPTLSAGRRELEDENRELRSRIEALERGGQRDAEALSSATEEEPGEDVAEDVTDEIADEPYEDVDDVDVEDDRPGEPEEPDDGEPDEHEDPVDDERPTRGNGRSGRSGRAKAERQEAPATDDAAGEPVRNGRTREGRGRARPSRETAERDGDEREMPVRRKPGSRRSSTPRER